MGFFLVLSTLSYYFWLTCLFAVVFFIKKNKFLNRVYFWIFAISLIIYFYFSVLGLDYGNYKRMFDTFFFSHKYILFKERIEFIFYYIIYFCKMYGLNYKFYFCIIKTIPFLINCYIINKTSKRKLEALFFLFFINFIPAYSDALRQNIAASFFLLAIYFWDKRKVYSVTSCIISIFSHYTSLSIVVVLAIAKFFNRLNSRKYILLIILELSVAYIVHIILLRLHLEDSNNYALKKFGYYLITSKLEIENSGVVYQILYKTMLYYNILFNILLASILLKNKNILKKIEKRILKIGIIGSLISFNLIFANIVYVSRFFLTYNYGYYLLIPYLNKKDKKKVIFLILISNFLVILYYINIHMRIFE